MNDLPNGFAVLAAMLGTDASVLRAISAPWVADPRKLPVSAAEFGRLLDAAHQLATAHAAEMRLILAGRPHEGANLVETILRQPSFAAPAREIVAAG